MHTTFLLVDVILNEVKDSIVSVLQHDAIQSKKKYNNLRVTGDFLPRLTGIWPCFRPFLTPLTSQVMGSVTSWTAVTSRLQATIRPTRGQLAKFRILCTIQIYKVVCTNLKVWI